MFYPRQSFLQKNGRFYLDQNRFKKLVKAERRDKRNAPPDRRSPFPRRHRQSSHPQFSLSLRAIIGAISSHHRVTLPQDAESTHDRAFAIRRRRRRVGDVPQSCLPVLEARELQGDWPRAGNAVPRYRKEVPLRLLGVRLKAH